MYHNITVVTYIVEHFSSDGRTYCDVLTTFYSVGLVAHKPELILVSVAWNDKP